MTPVSHVSQYMVASQLRVNVISFSISEDYGSTTVRKHPSSVVLITDIGWNLEARNDRLDLWLLRPPLMLIGTILMADWAIDYFVRLNGRFNNAMDIRQVRSIM